MPPPPPPPVAAWDDPVATWDDAKVTWTGLYALPFLWGGPGEEYRVWGRFMSANDREAARVD
jgi:hypothetical protein